MFDTILRVVLGCLFLPLILRCIYNRYFHPLRHIPGPIWGSLTDAYKLYVILVKHIPSFNLQLHQTYGPVVRVAPGLISISDPKLIPAIYHRHADKSDFYTHGVLGERPPTVQILDHNEHAAKRRIIAPLLGFKNICSHEDKIDERIIELLAALQSQTQSEIEFTKLTRWFLLDTMTHLVFGAPAGFVKGACDVDSVVHGLRQMSVFALLLGTFPYLVKPIINQPFFRKRIIPHVGDQRGTGRMMTYVNTRLSRRMEGYDKQQNDFLDILLQIQAQNPEALSIEEVETECLMLIVASLDSTAGLVCPFINNMIQNPDISQQLMEEIDTFERMCKLSYPVGKYDETCQMPYLMACIQETIRFGPSTPVILPRYISKGGLYLNGMWIPEGAEVGANPFVINHDPIAFGADSYLFRPTRWLQEDGKVKQMEKTIFTFGYGARGCLGSQLARFESQKVCLELLRKLRFVSGTKDGPWAIHEDRGFAIYEQQWVKVTKREGQEKGPA